METETDVEVVDGLPVLVDAQGALSATPEQGLVPVRQAAAVGVAGFAAGAATLALAHRRKTRKAIKRRKKKQGVIGEVIGSNSFLVDVHLLKRN